LATSRVCSKEADGAIHDTIQPDREALRQSLQSRFDWRSKAEQTATVLRAAMRVE
jgi:hypothetical protein